jgi:hypothetical protein
MSRLTGSILAVSVLAAACGSGDSSRSSPEPARVTSTPVATIGSPDSTPAASGPVAEAPPDTVFDGTSERITGGLRDRIVGSSWHAGCPVGLDDLRVLRLDRWGFDGKAHRGTLVVHRRYVRDLIQVFRTLFDARFPIRRMRLVDAYGADDDRSMAANNTSAFNCRAITGGSAWSQHSYGWAIDINPIQNPYVTSRGTVLPPAGAAYVNRSKDAKGLIRAGGVVVKAFAEIGWGWGGHWSSIKDYQHFSATGR